MKHWGKAEALPLVLIIGCAVGGMSFMLARASQSPDVVYSSKNLFPYERIDQNTQVKLWHPKMHFEKRYSRFDRLGPELLNTSPLWHLFSFHFSDNFSKLSILIFVMFSKEFSKIWIKPEVFPIVAIVTFAVSGAAWYVTRLARGPEVVWTQSNLFPYTKIDQDTQVKLVTINQKFSKKYERWF